MTTSRNPSLNGKRSAVRIDNLRRLIAELQTRSMRPSDICALLGMKRSGARGYIDELRGPTEVTRGALFAGGGHSYRITEDADVEGFLASLGKPRKQEASRAEKMAGAGRLIHVLADDTHYAIRLMSRLPQHEPVLAAFYGIEARA